MTEIIPRNASWLLFTSPMFLAPTEDPSTSITPSSEKGFELAKYVLAILPSASGNAQHFEKMGPKTVNSSKVLALKF
jgi:hypothetical protein